MEQFDQITQIELEDSQAENKNLLNQIDEITKHAEAEKFELKIQLEESVKERELLERLENVRMEELRELKIQKSDLEKRLLVMSYEEISKQKTDQLFQLKITQIELEEVQAENKNLLNQMAQITKHAEAEKFELKIQLEESAKERQLLERLENVRMEELRELKIQKSELENRLLVMSYEEISKQKIADLELENAAIIDSHKDFIWRSKQESRALREELYRIERQQIVDREQCENDIRRMNNTKHGHAVYRLYTHHTK
ncbi:zygote defective protein 12-like, partial [Ruditapes philippinarum]|uniref:zygote defective protein 12-like n=1 Tax=Ruditapes philippinarum TaxID=129788 RepID=UPI00295AB962